MNGLLQSLAITGAAVGTLIFAAPAVAQHPPVLPSPTAAVIPPPAPRNPDVKFVKLPWPELVFDGSAIIAWEMDNPAGPDKHWCIARYGTDPNGAGWQETQSSITLNREQQKTTCRVLLPRLAPATTYYYTVTSKDTNEVSTGLRSDVLSVKTLALGQRPSR